MTGSEGKKQRQAYPSILFTSEDVVFVKTWMI